MSLAALLVVTTALFLVLHLWAVPGAYRRAARSSGGAAVAAAAFYALVDVCRSIAALATIAAGVCLGLLCVAEFGRFGDLAQVQASVRLAAGWRATLEQISPLLSIAIAVICGLGLVLLGRRAARVKVAGVLAAADRTEAEEILEQLRRGSAEEMPDTAEMAEIRAKLAELGAEIAALEQELAKAAPSENGALESRLQERRNRLETGILFLIRLDISRRRGPAKPVGDFVPAPRSRWERFEDVLFSRGTITTITGASRLAFIVATLLLVPSLLAIATVPAGVDLAAAEVQLSQIQLKLQGQAAEQEFDAVAATPPPAPNSALSDEQALNQLAHLYDHAVTLHYVKVGGLNDHSVSHVRLEATREHILHSAASHRPGGHPPLPTVNDFATSSVERYYIDMATGRPLSPEAARFRDEMRTELVEKRPDVWRVMKAKAEGLAQSFHLPEDLGTLRAMLVSRVATAAFDVGHTLPPDIASLGSGIEDSVAEDAYRFRSRKAWTAFLSAHDGNDVIAAMNADNDPAIEIERDEAVARRVPEMDALEQRLAAEPPRFPAPREPDTKEATEIARAIMAASPRDGATLGDSLATFDDFFPGHIGAETRTARGVLIAESGVKVDVPSEVLARMASNFTMLRGFSRIGGVLIGRDASNSDERLDFNGLSWRTTPRGVVLTFMRSDHKEILLDPRPPSLIAQALAYAADGRPVTATMTSAAPLKDLKVLAHPTLVDTAVGCRAIEIDRFVDTALAHDPRGKAIDRGVDDAFARIGLYNFAQRAFSIGYLAQFPDGDKVRAMRERLSSQYDVLRSRATLDDVDLNTLMDPDRSPLPVKGAFFQTDVVHAMADCLPGARADADAFGKCMVEKGRAFEGQVDGIFRQPTDFFPWSGVREREWSLDPDLAFATRSPARDPLYPFEFVEQLAALGPANFAGNGEQSGGSYVDADPFTFPAYRDQITQIVVDGVLPDPRSREILEDMRQFTLLERLFRAALAGQLGPSFPVERLSELADATSSTVKPAHTPRWTPHPGKIEKKYLDDMSDLADSLKSVGKYDKLVTRHEACLTGLEAKAKTWPETARIPDAEWASICDLEDAAKDYPELSADSKDDAAARAAYMVELSQTLRQARQLRVAVGVPAEETAIAEQIRTEQAGGRICPAL